MTAIASRYEDAYAGSGHVTDKSPSQRFCCFYTDFVQ